MLEQHDIPLVEEIDAMEAEYRRIRAKPATAKRGSPERLVARAGIKWLRLVLPVGSIVASTETEQRGSGRTEEERARFGAARKASGIVTGWFDAVALCPGPLTILIEWKAPGGVISPAQQSIHAQARALGFIVIVADSIESLRLGLHQEGVATREAAGQPMRAAKVRGLAA